jgi:hypothetical protein
VLQQQLRHVRVVLFCGDVQGGPAVPEHKRERQLQQQGCSARLQSLLGLVVDIGTEVQQQTRHIQVICEGGNVQSRCVVPEKMRKMVEPLMGSLCSGSASKTDPFCWFTSALCSKRSLAMST